MIYLAHLSQFVNEKKEENYCQLRRSYLNVEKNNFSLFPFIIIFEVSIFGMALNFFFILTHAGDGFQNLHMKKKRIGKYGNRCFSVFSLFSLCQMANKYITRCFIVLWRHINRFFFRGSLFLSPGCIISFYFYIHFILKSFKRNNKNEENENQKYK